MKLFLPTVAYSALFMFLGTSNALNVKVYGINYNMRQGADWEPEHIKCKSVEQVQKDMYALKQVTDRVRIYSLVDCNQAEHLLPAAKRAGLQVHLGIWTTKDHNYLLQEKANLARIIDLGLYDNNIIGLHVGSETIYRKEITAETAIAYMNEIRGYLRSRNIYTPVTIADVIDVYYEYPQIADAVDYYNVNEFAYWEGVDTNEGAAKTLDRIRAIRVKAYQTNKVMNLAEVGWSSGGYNKTTGDSSPASQAKFFSDFYKVATSVNMPYYWYTAFDSKWRVTNGGHDVEAYFGVFQEDDTMKRNFQDLTIELNTPRGILSDVTKLLLTEVNAGVVMTGKTNNRLEKEQQTWFFDFKTQQVRSQSGDRCLDAFQPWDGGKVHCYRCMDNEKNQKWAYEQSTGKLKHATYNGFCLDVDIAKNNLVQLYGCSPNNPNQKWTILDAASI